MHKRSDRKRPPELPLKALPAQGFQGQGISGPPYQKSPNWFADELLQGSLKQGGNEKKRCRRPYVFRRTLKAPPASRGPTAREIVEKGVSLKMRNARDCRETKKRLTMPAD